MKAAERQQKREDWKKAVKKLGQVTSVPSFNCFSTAFIQIRYPFVLTNASKQIPTSDLQHQSSRPRFLFTYLDCYDKLPLQNVFKAFMCHTCRSVDLELSIEHFWLSNLFPKFINVSLCFQFALSFHFVL